VKSVAPPRKAGVNRKNAQSVLRQAQCRNRKTRSHPVVAAPAKNNFCIRMASAAIKNRGHSYAFLATFKVVSSTQHILS